MLLGVVMVEVLFQLLNADYFMNGPKPVVRLFGRKADGKSVCIMVNGFEPYFYVKGENNKISLFLDEEKAVKKVEEVEKFLPIGYRDKKTKLLKVITYSPKDVPGIRDKLEAEDYVDSTYESDVLFKYRFLVNYKIHGMDWVSVDGTKIYSPSTKAETYEIDVASAGDKIKVVEKIENASVKYMSFDIECVGNDLTRFIDAKQDPIIMISFNFSHNFRGSKSLVLCAKHVTMDKKDDISLRCFSEEKEMLEEFLRVVSDYDPDIVTGYNINGFDIPFILERLRINKLPTILGRTPDQTYVRSFGMNNDSIISGRVVADPFQILKGDVYVRLPRYDLGTVAEEMLGDNKLDIKHRDMGTHWKTLEGTRKIIKYCLKDSKLALDLMLQKRLLDKFFELSKVSGVLLQDSLGGQSARIEIRVLHEFRDTDYVLPVRPNDAVVRRRMLDRQKKGLKGAIVLEPEKGLHTKGCTLILDFKSLYPSLIITYNLSPDTLLNKDSPKLADKDKHETPLHDWFVDANTHKGILPRILEELMISRGVAKQAMNKAKTDGERAILDARQSALKILLNSFYGYTGFVRGRLYAMEVAGGITSHGRKNLLKTKKLIEEKFGLKLLYADTDSTLIETDINDLDKAKKLGDEISKYVTENLPGVLDLEFEKIYRTFLILTKKRYAGWAFTPIWDENGKMGWKDKLEMKGIETVRRDWCPLVSKTLNNVINIILKEGDIKKAVEFIKTVINDVKLGKVDIDKLVVVKGITKALTAYKGIQPHIELARKLNARNPEEPIAVGDRLGYVITRGNEMLSKRAENVEYVKEKGLEIDSDYYIDRQLLPPVERILASLGVEKNELLGFGRQASISDIMLGKERVMKHDIKMNQETGNTKQSDNKKLDEIDGYCCEKCKKCFDRPPLSGKCACGGGVVFASKK